MGIIVWILTTCKYLRVSEVLLAEGEENISWMMEKGDESQSQSQGYLQ